MSDTPKPLEVIGTEEEGQVQQRWRYSCRCCSEWATAWRKIFPEPESPQSQEEET